MCPIWNLGTARDVALDGIHCGWELADSRNNTENCHWSPLPYKSMGEHPQLANNSVARNCVFFDGSKLTPTSPGNSTTEREVYLRLRLTSPLSDNEANEKEGAQ